MPRPTTSPLGLLVQEARDRQRLEQHVAGAPKAAPGAARENTRPAPEFRLDSLAVSGPSSAVRGRRSLTLPVSLAVHALVVLALLVVPLLMGESPPPTVAMRAFFVEPAAAPPPPPPPPRAASVAAPKTRPSAAPPSEFRAPIEVPTEVKPEQDLDLGSAAGVAGGVEGGVPGGVVGGIVGGLAEGSGAPLRVGGMVKEPQKIRDMRPVYPPLALAARVQGVVIIEATVGADGRVAEARILRGVPILDDAALDAVRHWVYTPTLLNGVPTPLIMTVTVTFRVSSA